MMPPRGGVQYSSAQSSPGPACSHAPSIQPGSSGESAAASGDAASKAASPRILIRIALPLLRAWLPATALGEYQSFPLIRSEEHTSELQSLLRISYAVFCLKKK